MHKLGPPRWRQGDAGYGRPLGTLKGEGISPGPCPSPEAVLKLCNHRPGSKVSWQVMSKAWRDVT